MMKRLKFLETKRTPRYSLRKLNVGVASVLLGVTIFGINFTNHSVKAATTESVESSNSSPNSNSQQTSAAVLTTAEQTKGINAMKVPDSQNDANKAIDAALNTKQSEINGAPNIDQTTKDKLNQAATDAADKAKEAITKATTNNDVATEQTNTQKATSATGKVQQSSASNNATANNSTEAATTLQSAPKTQGSAGSGVSGSSATEVVSGSQGSNSQAASATSSAANASQAAPETQVPAPAAGQSSESANSGNATSSQASQAGTVSANHTAIGTTPSSQTVSVNETTSSATQARTLMRTLMTNLAVINPVAAESTQNIGTDTKLPPTTQTYTKVEQPLLSDYLRHVSATGTRDGQTWVDKTVAKGVFGYDYPGDTLDTIFRKPSKPGIKPEIKPGIITGNPDKYFFAAYVDFSESYHRVILLARSQDPSDKNLYSYTIHTYTQNTSTTTTKPGDSTKEQYTGIGGSTHDLIFQNYDGDSFTVKLNGFEGGYGLTPIFDQGILNPKYKDKTLDELDGKNGINYKEQIGSWASVIPQETTTSVRYVDLETGKDIAQPLIVTGYGYQGFKINGDAPKIDGYTLVSSPKTLGLSYEDGIIAPYKVGQTYTQYFTDDVYVKQTVIDTNGTVIATAYYKKQPLGTSASKILGHNDSMSFMAGGQGYTYNNRINDVDAAMVYYYQKVGEEGKSQLRVHYIDVTKDTDDSQYAPGDGVPATNSISGQEKNPLTYTGNIGHTYDYATNAVPEGYVLVGTSPNIKGTFSKSDHDAYIYVKIDRNGAKATIENLTHLNHAQKQAAEAAIDQATDLNTMNQATSTATKLDGDMGKLSDLTADLTNTNNYKYASDTPKSTVATDCTEADALLDKTAGQNADDATVLNLIGRINTHKSSLDGDTNLSAAEKTISGLTHLNDAQRSAANQAVTNASDLTGLKTAVGNAQSVDSAMSDLQTAVNQANEAKTTNNYLQASADKQDNLNSAVQNAQAVLAATGANYSANQVKALTKSVNDAVDALDGDANTKKQADQNIDDVAKAAKQAIDNTNGLTADQKQAANDQIDQAVTAAKDNINKASDDTGVAAATDAGKLAIDKVSANAAIDGALAEKNNSIEGAPNLTSDEKQAVKDQAKKAADSAKTAISSASTVGDVASAKKTGVETINTINVPATSATKEAAKKAIDQAAQTKNEAIEKSNLTDEEKAALHQQVSDEVNKAKENIRNASTDEDVQTARNNGIAAIEEITVKSNSVDDQDNSATNAGDSSQTGHIQKGDTTDAGNITPTIPGGKLTVKDPNHLTDDEKNRVKKNVEDANKGSFPAGTVITVGDNGTTTVTYPDGSKDVIAGTDLVIAPKSEDVLGSKYHSHKNGSNSSQADRVKGASTANGSIANAGNNLGVKGESDNAIGNNKATSLKTLPQTGTKDTSILGVLGMLLASLGLFGFKKKRDKE